MDSSQLLPELMQAEALLYEGKAQQVVETLSRLAEDAQEYVAANCVTTEKVQYFSFPTYFELLAYRRVENDPRELRDVGEPLDRLYADLGLACVMVGEYDLATEAYKQAVRWNPMECEYRLRLADLFATNGNIDEYLALTYSVFERASEAGHIARAFVNFAQYYQQSGRAMLCAAALRRASKFQVKDKRVVDALEEAEGTEHDPALLDDKETSELLATEGLPDGANAEIAISLLMCALDAGKAQDKTLATNLVIRARGLVGSAAVAAILELIKDADADLAQERAQEEA